MPLAPHPSPLPRERGPERPLWRGLRPLCLLFARRSPHPAAKRFVPDAFRIGCAMRKALSLFSHRLRDAKSLVYCSGMNQPRLCSRSRTHRNRGRTLQPLLESDHSGLELCYELL